MLSCEELERLRKLIYPFTTKDTFISLSFTIKTMADEIFELRKKAKLLLEAKEVLEFYADHSAKTNLYGRCISQYNSDAENYEILSDKGARAREFLKKLNTAKVAENSDQ